MKLSYLLLPGLLACASPACGQSTDDISQPQKGTGPPADSTGPASPAAPLTFYGYVEAYYGFDFDHDGSSQRPCFLYSHSRQNEFAVNNALLGGRYDDGRVRGALGLHAGTYAAASYASEDAVMRHVYEAYAGFRPFRRAWLDLGIFPSHIGFEAVLSKDNWNLTHTLLAENSPYYEAGARLTYEAGPRLTLTGLVLNGWQNIGETNQAKALGTQVQWRPTDKLLLNSSTFYGNEQPTDSLKRRRYYHNFYLTYVATRRLSVAAELDLGTQQGAGRRGYDSWYGGALFVRCQLAARASATLRGEYYQAQRGVIVSSFSPRAADADFAAGGPSLNLDYAPNSHVLVRLEGRYLQARDAVFQHESGGSRHYGNLTSSVALSF